MGWLGVGNGAKLLENVFKWGRIYGKWGVVGKIHEIHSTQVMLLGEFKHNLDTKGRLAIPAKFRSSFSAGAIITRGLDDCLFIFSREEWEALAKKLVSLPIAAANSRAFVRLMLSGASDVELDSQGRVLIPDYLREFASVRREAVVTGLYNRIEVWDSARWNEYKKRTERSSQEIAERMNDLGI